MPFDSDPAMPFTGASPAALALYHQALEAYHCFAGDPIGLLDQAIDDSPGFVMARLLKAWLPMTGSTPSLAAWSAALFEEARILPMNDREAAHAAAVGHMLAGRFSAAGRLFEDISIAWPHDTLALQAGQQVDFLTGDARMLRDRVGRVLPRWDRQRPGYHALLAMHAFGLEECGQYARAEAAGREAIALQPRNGWAQHAVAHVLEMQDRRAEGVAWMTEDRDRWTRDSFFIVHNSWHLALFHLGLGEIDEALALYDATVRGLGSEMAFDLADAAAMLWRLMLRGVEVGDRWDDLADAWAAAGGEGVLAFNDAHAAMTFVGAGRMAPARAMLATQERAARGEGDNARAAGRVGVDLVAGLIAFGEARYGEAVDRLRAIRNGAWRFGGSHAQRDVIDLTLIEAARRDGQAALVAALEAERRLARG